MGKGVQVGDEIKIAGQILKTPEVQAHNKLYESNPYKYETYMQLLNKK